MGRAERRGPVVLALALILAGCGLFEPDPIAPWWFDPERILELDIEMDPDDWEAARHQTRNLMDVFGSDCLAEPYGRPFTYFPGDLHVEGHTRRMVGVRKKAFLGSLDTEKPSLKIKLNEYGGRNLEGMRRITLNNAKQDPAFVRQCLGYDLFAQAGFAAARCTFARVRVNGEDLGLYVHLETLKRRFFEGHFGSYEGNLYKGVISDFRPEWDRTFERKNNDHDPDRSDIEAITAALQVDDDALLEALAAHIDVDQFIRFWAMESLLGHWDGYAGNTNNFYLYRSPLTDRFEFIPWDLDQTFARPGGHSPPAVFGTGYLAQRLFALPESRARYIDAMRDLLETVWDEPAILREIDRMEALIGPEITDEARAAMDEVRSFVEGRRGELEYQLDSGLPGYAFSPRDPLCFEEIGHLAGTFDTTFGTIDDHPFFSGSATLEGSIEGEPVTVEAIGSRSGVDAEDPSRVQVQIIATLPGGDLRLVALSLPPEDLQPGTLPLDWGTRLAFVVRIVPGTDQVWVEGLVGEGTVTFEAAAPTDEAPVRGHFTGTLLRSPF